MKTKLIMTVALLATFANAQFFTNALASQLKQEQQQTTETVRTDNANQQAATIDIENDHAELVNICRETWYRIHRTYTRPSRLQVRILTERYAGETNAPHCMNMYGIYSGEWGTSADKGEK